jgi:hypothetical protein
VRASQASLRYSHDAFSVASELQADGSLYAASMTASEPFEQTRSSFVYDEEDASLSPEGLGTHHKSFSDFSQSLDMEAVGPPPDPPMQQQTVQQHTMQPSLLPLSQQQNRKQDDGDQDKLQELLLASQAGIPQQHSKDNQNTAAAATGLGSLKDAEEAHPAGIFCQVQQ